MENENIFYRGNYVVQRPISQGIRSFSIFDVCRNTIQISTAKFYENGKFQTLFSIQ